MIFARRALQRRLLDLRGSIGDVQVDKLVRELNRPDPKRLGFVWETVLLHALTKFGTVQNEAVLPTGSRPDITFDDGTLKFTADVATVSDTGLDESNPYSELSELIERAKRKLKLPIGGLDVQVKSNRQRSAKGAKTTLRLPPRAQLDDSSETRSSRN